ncbi:MAG: DNA replication/repair protein RecF [Thermoanaerobacteraceae bacterium]|nr:DNA replication/repair protein RecF [Thermoanaerobacteraceae bacterium]
MQATLLTELALYNFRNYTERVFYFRPGLHLLTGPNGAGKTNLLEAIAYLSTGRSFRFHQDRDLVTLGRPGFRLRACLKKGNQGSEIDIVYDGGRKKLTINNSPHRLVDLLGLFPTVTFGPDDLYLVKGPPVIRRQFLDRELCQVDRSYCLHLLTYRRVLLQRNLLLKQIKGGQARADQLEPWDQQLVFCGLPLVEKRQEVLRRLEGLADQFYAVLAGASSSIALCYQPSLSPADDWLKRLAEKRDKEIIMGATLLGPHRDDFTFEVGGRSGRHYASQGEQRSLVLALKLAETVYFTQVLGFRPALLLDDVFSELDGNRRKALLKVVAGEGQAFITTTQVEDIPPEVREKAFILACGGTEKGTSP